MNIPRVFGSNDAENISVQQQELSGLGEAAAMGPKIMIVDDSAFMRTMIKNLIQTTDSEIVGEAGSGEEAVTLYEQLRPNLVFLDIIMPGMSGIEALKHIKTLDKDANVVMCTSVGQEQIIAEAVAAGASDFVVKPFTQEDIISIVKKIGG